MDSNPIAGNSADRRNVTKASLHALSGSDASGAVAATISAALGLASDGCSRISSIRPLMAFIRVFSL